MIDLHVKLPEETNLVEIRDHLNSIGIRCITKLGPKRFLGTTHRTSLSSSTGETPSHVSNPVGIAGDAPVPAGPVRT